MPEQTHSLTFNRLRYYFGAYLFILPAVTVFTIFYIVPFFFIFKLSLHQWDGIAPTMTFVGLEHFIDLFTENSDWWRSMWHACYITLIALTLQNMLAFGLALACDREIRMKRFYRMVFFIPPVLSEIVVGKIWRWVLKEGMQGGEFIGILNYALSNIGLAHLASDWLSSPETALTCVAIVHSWKGFGWGFIILLAGLQTIDKQLYEAARVDGANSWSTFWNVTIPMMVPVILVVMVLTILGSMQVFILVLSMTPGGVGGTTDVPVLLILSKLTSTKQYGYACTMGVTFGVILILTSFILKRISDKVKQA